MGSVHDLASGLVPRLAALGVCLLLQMGDGVAGIGSVVKASFEGRSCRVRSALGISTLAKAARSHEVPRAGLGQIELERPKFQTPPESPRHSQTSVTPSRARGERERSALEHLPRMRKPFDSEGLRVGIERGSAYCEFRLKQSKMSNRLFSQDSTGTARGRLAAPICQKLGRVHKRPEPPRQQAFTTSARDGPPAAPTPRSGPHQPAPGEDCVPRLPSARRGGFWRDCAQERSRKNCG
jgi:hypothetical protein